MSANLLGPRSLLQRRPVLCSYIPDYRPKLPGQKRPTWQELQAAERPEEGQDPSVRRWWDYKAPKNYKSPPSYQIMVVGLPEYGPGSGGSGGSSGGGGGGGSGDGGSGGSGNGGGSTGGDPMRGWTFLFSFLLFAGGLAAYIKRGSTKSLMASTAVSTLLLITTSLTGHSVGTWLALGTCLVLAGYMGQRARQSGKVFPSGAVALASAVMSIGYIRSLWS